MYALWLVHKLYGRVQLPTSPISTDHRLFPSRWRSPGWTGYRAVLNADNALARVGELLKGPHSEVKVRHVTTAPVGDACEKIQWRGGINECMHVRNINIPPLIMIISHGCSQWWICWEVKLKLPISYLSDGSRWHMWHVWDGTFIREGEGQWDPPTSVCCCIHSWDIRRGRCLRLSRLRKVIIYNIRDKTQEGINIHLPHLMST